MKQQKELVVLVVLLVIAGNIWYWFFFRQKDFSARRSRCRDTELQPIALRRKPAPHTDRREAARRAVYKSNGRNPFSSIAPPPPSKDPGKVVVTRERMGPQLEPPPPPPEIPPNMHFSAMVRSLTAHPAVPSLRMEKTCSSSPKAKFS